MDIIENIVDDLLENYRPEDNMFTSPKEVEYIAEVLQLEQLDGQALIALRNMVVIKYHKISEELRTERKMDQWMEYSSSMMSITAVIDLYRRKLNQEI